MKKLFVPLTIALSLAFFSSNAQKKSADGEVSFGIRAGVNFQNITGKDNNGDKFDNSIKTGFHIGVNAELPITGQFYMQPGLLFTTKGAKVHQDGANGFTNISYIELPINFLYKSEMGSGKFIFGFGPYAAYGVGGKLEYSGNGVDVSKSLKFKGTVSLVDYLANFGAYVKPFDFGLNFLAGYELSGNLSIQLNGQLGLVKVYPKIDGFDDKGTAKNTGFGVSVGYRF